MPRIGRIKSSRSVQGAQLLAHAADMNIDAAIEEVQRAAQRDLGDLFAGDHAAGMAQQQFQNIELDGGEIDRLASAGDGASAKRHADIADDQHLIVLGCARGGRRLAGAAKDGADSGDQFAGIERLGQVVVGADFQAEDAVNGLASGGKQKHGNRRLLAQRFQQLESRAAGQHHVQHDQLVLAGQRRAQSGSVIVGGIHAEAFAFEKAFQQVDQGVVVIHDEQAVHGIYFALSRARLR